MENAQTRTISAAVITRNRAASLRRTLLSLQRSTHPFLELIVSDDSTEDATVRMLTEEFAEVRCVQGPRTGRSGNRNAAIRASKGNYILMCDDDVLVDPAFASIALEAAETKPDSLFFPRIEEHGWTYPANALDFLGFATKPYAPGEPYHTAHSQCFILARSITDRVLYDEIVSLYGFEEFDFTYRVAREGFTIVHLPQCVCQHLEPNPNEPFRQGKDASRMYLTFKRHFFVDHNPLKGLAFAVIAPVHHVLASFKRAWWMGASEGVEDVRLAARMLRRYLRGSRPTRPSSTSGV